MVYTSDLESLVLRPPQVGCRKILRIVTGYASVAMAHRQLVNEAKAGLQLVVGMCYADGLYMGDYLGFKELRKKFRDRFFCSYIDSSPPVHAKAYVWVVDDKPFRAFVGSANFTQNAFLSPTVEAVAEADPESANAFFLHVQHRSTDCEALPHVKLLSPLNQTFGTGVSGVSVLSGLPKETISLLDKNGGVPVRSGLNWGQRKNRNPDEAYLRVPSTVGRSGFLPPHGVVFTLLTDDGAVLSCRTAQQGSKAIETWQDNAELGRYFRRRLGLKPGEMVTKEALENYGRTDYTLYRIDYEHYYLDFSVSKTHG